MRVVPFAILGCGLMGREFAGAAARWNQLADFRARPEIVAVCDVQERATAWFRDRCPSVRLVSTDYRELLADPGVAAVYCALPHHLHREIYVAAIEAGKHLMGEKPFGIDLAANRSILEALARHSEVLARCSSEFPFYPAMQRIGKMIEGGCLGRLLEVNAGFLHSGDLDPQKPLNWKRMARFNGEYGCMGDLGMHVCHVPFRAGWIPRNVRAVLSNVVCQRPDQAGNMAPCDTWDNAQMLCETRGPSGELFPMTLKTQRIAPGEKNTWYMEILGMETSVRFSTKNPRRLEVMNRLGGDQVWGCIDMGHETAYPTVSGSIFECGFTDVILQMWAAYVDELDRGRPASRFAGCVTPEETALSHRLFTAALKSHQSHSVVTL